MSRPNIVFICSDQHRHDCLGVGEHPLAHTPNLDRLAREGIRFGQAYCPSPICVPARASLLTGQWPGEHGAIANLDTEAPASFAQDLPTWPPLLRGAGYRLGHVGKWGAHARLSPRDLGIEDYYPEADYHDWRAARGLPPRDNAEGWWGGVDASSTPEQTPLGWGATRTIELLERYAGSDQPFMVRWDPREPHLPNFLPEPHASMIDPRRVEPWLSFGDLLEGKPYIQAQQRRTWGVDGYSWEHWAPIVARYLGDVALLDEQVGRVLDALERLGLTENTLVIYTADHGDLCGAHGMVDKHYVMYEDVVRVPLLARLPGRIAAGRTCDAFVCNALDLASAFCELAGATVPDTFRGQSLLALLDGEDENGREDIFASYHGNQFGLYSQRMVRDRRWKYVWNATAEDELYDLAHDPGELHNMAIDVVCAPEIKRLRERLVAWMEATHDPLLNGLTRRQLLDNRTR